MFNRETVAVPRDELKRQHLIDAIARARQEGIDVEPWLRARMLIFVFGSAAEARHTGRSIVEVWNSAESELDLKGAVKDGLSANLSTVEIAGFIDLALEQVATLIDQPPIQRAINALADALPAAGQLTGRMVTSIISTAMRSE